MIATFQKRFVRIGCTAAAGLVLCAGVIQGAQAQGAFPNHPVRLYVGSSAGGAPDSMGRALAKMLGETWSQPMVVENKPGAAGLLAADLVSKAAPDGYTLCLLLDSVLINVPFLTARMPLDPVNDLKPISMVGNLPLILVANPDQKYKTLKEFIADARANPGKIDFGSSGVGSSVHLAMEVLQHDAGIKLNHVPYKGGLPALQDVIAGHLPVMWSTITAAQPFLPSHRVIALGIGTARRYPLLPAIPTFAEQGFPGFTASTWVGLLGPANMPEPLVQKIHADLARVAQNPAYQEQMLAQGIEPLAMSSEEFASRIRIEYGRNKTLFSKLGIGPE